MAGAQAVFGAWRYNYGSSVQESSPSKSGTWTASQLGANELSENTQADIGAVDNLVTSDTFNIASLGADLHLLWVVFPVQITIALVLLYRVLVIRPLAGLVTILTMFPFNIRIAQSFGLFNKLLWLRQISVFSRPLTCYRTSRESSFLPGKILCGVRLRTSEPPNFTISDAAGSLVFCSHNLVHNPSLITFLSLLIYMLWEDKPLVPSVAFTAISLFAPLKVPIDQFSEVLTRIQTSSISLKLVTDPFKESETEKYEQTEEGQVSANKYVIGFQNASFCWSPSLGKTKMPAQTRFKLHNLDFTFETSSLNLVLGPIASGMSSMLLAFFGELTLESG